MPEWVIWLCLKILEKGIRDMVRISDGRMSGTAYGTAVLHVSPESAIGGNLALVQNGDMIELDVEQRKLHLDVPEEELERRRTNWKAPKAAAERLCEFVYKTCIGCWQRCWPGFSTGKFRVGSDKGFALMRCCTKFPGMIYIGVVQ